MMKSYLRYQPDKSFGVVASINSNITYDWSGNLVLSGSGENVSVWNVRQGALISSLTNEAQGYPYVLPGEVVFVVYSPDKTSVAVGYSTGEVCIFQYLKSTTKSASLRGHQTAVSCLAYDAAGTLLASGGRDGDVVVWDAVSCAGQARLRGHKDAVTGVAFLRRGVAVGDSAGQQLVVSVSKDTLLKVWDLSTQHCVQTIVGHRAEIWALAVHYPSGEHSADADAVAPGGEEAKRSKYAMPSVVTGCSDDLIRGYCLAAGGAGPADAQDVLEYVGCVKLAGGEKCTHIEFNSQGTLPAALTGQKNVELFHFRGEAEARKKLKRRQKRAREKAAARAEDGPAAELEAAPGGEQLVERVTLADCLEPFSTIRCPHKVKSFSISRAATHSTKGRHAGEDSLALSMVNNVLELYHVVSVPSESAEMGSSKRSVIEMQGHRSDVRCVALSSDGLQIASCSSDGVRVWSSVSFQCLRRCATGYGVSLVFAPGGRYVIVGTREGRLQVVDCASGDMTADLEAHEGSVWSLHVHPDGKGLVSGGADKFIKFWEFGVENSTLSLSQWREMEMTHDVLCVRFSPSKSVEKSLVAVGLLDSTIKIFFNNSMKFFLSLYGHKLSVMCLDISSDGAILISGSADKTVKIWGLDFGDCHRSLLGHEDSVTALRFQPETHYFFSASKDGTVKYWDADRFQQILNLPGHFSCVWSLDMPMDASFCVSGSQDRSLRVWRRTEDLVFIEEERERAFEAQADSAAARDASAGEVVSAEMERDALAHPFSAVGSVQTVDSLKSGERLLEAIDLVEAELQEAPGGASANPLLLRMAPLDYMVHSLRSIRASDLEQALLVLPFHCVARLIKLLCRLCQRGSDVELVAKCCLFLFRAHQPRIMATSSLAPEVAILSETLRSNLASWRRLVGTNMAALRYSQKLIEDEKSDKFAFREEIMTMEGPEKKGGKGKQNKRKSDSSGAPAKRNKI